MRIIDQTGDHHREARRGDGAGPARPGPPKPSARLTLRQMRERAGVPLGDLAAQAGVCASTLRKFETGIPDLAPATYAYTIAALEALISRTPTMSGPLAVVKTQEIEGDEGSDVMTTCLATQILRDADNAKLFCDLCRRTSRLSEEGQPCPLVSDEARILLVSSRRPLTSTPLAHRPRG